jgi:hypothetical protein
MPFQEYWTGPMPNIADSVDHLRLEIEAMLREYPELAEDDVARLDTLDGVTDVREMLERLARNLDDTKGLQEGVHIRIDELSARESRFMARCEILRCLMFKLMDGAQIKKIELAEATLSLRNSPPRLVGEADPQSLPDDLCKITRTVSRTKVREAIESGHRIEGFQLSNAQPSLVVKVK